MSAKPLPVDWSFSGIFVKKNYPINKLRQTRGKTAVINGFKSKAGKVFSAALKFDEKF
jgi:hypothetical protein